jgi:hypothetical protein
MLPPPPLLLLLLLQVVSGLPALQELALGSTRLSGNLTCDLPASLKVQQNSACSAQLAAMLFL